MMRSLYAGVSGLQNHQTRMDVLGNNIANVNTVGFKKGRVTFQDMLYQTLSSAVRPGDEVGGVNPKQLGLGMLVASIDSIHTQGSLQTTGVMTDLAIQGEGFFVLKAGEKMYFSRAGAFGIDEQGNLVNPANGMRVQGWQAVTEGGTTTLNTSASVENLIIPLGGKDAAAATSEVDVACNLDKRLPEISAGATPQVVDAGTYSTSIDIYDSFGNTHTLALNFTKALGVANRWQVAVQVDPGSEVDRNTTVEVGAANNVDNVFFLDFDNLGALQAVQDAQGDSIEAGDLRIQFSYDVPDADIPAGIPSYRETVNLNLGSVGAYRESITQFAEKSSTKVIRQNGYIMGYLESFKIDKQGVISGIYSNGTNRILGQVALATFGNPGGLEKAGENNFVETTNSGAANIGPSGIGGKGLFLAGALEMSNVDLAEQFTNMIVTQRGFQANSRTIITTDQMIQELLTLKR